MKPLSRPIFLVSTLLILAACTQEPGPETEAASASSEDYLGPGEIAIVDGVRIPESIFRVYTLGAFDTEVENLTDEGKDEVLERLVYVQVLANEAERRGLQHERVIAAELELQRRQYLARALATRYNEENPPSEMELRDMYEENLPRLRANEYQTRHILVDSETEAQDLVAQLEDGADFSELAMEFSIDTGSAGEGGDLGWVRADSVVVPFSEAIQAATMGVPTAPIETQYGWHVILVEDVREQAAPGLDAVREEVRAAVQNQKLNAFAAELKEASEITMIE